MREQNCLLEGKERLSRVEDPDHKKKVKNDHAAGLGGGRMRTAGRADPASGLMDGVASGKDQHGQVTWPWGSNRKNGHHDLYRGYGKLLAAERGEE